MIPEPELQRLESVRACTLALVEDLSQAEIDRPSDRGGWSVGEILDHLLRAEASNRNQIAELIGLARSGREPVLRHDLTTTDIAPAFLPRALLPLLSVPFTFATLFVPFSLRQALVRNRLFAARASDELRPRRGRPADELRAELARSVAETRRLLAGNQDLDFRRMVFRHPLLGANDVVQILLLTAVHEERHQDQIRQILAPAAGGARRQTCAT